MRLLKDILYKVSVVSVQGSTDIGINGINFDSRKVREQDLFVAQKGSVVDGHDFMDMALARGAVAVICENLPQSTRSHVTYIVVDDANIALSIMASNYYDNPSSRLQLVGVTGTNGKTSVTSLLYQLFKQANYKVGLLSTVKIMVDDQEFKATHTTPDALSINKYLAAMVAEGVVFCFMEVSSHGIHQKRTTGLQFSGGVFTNLSHDHLDYHETFAEYRDVKKSFFDKLTKTAFALTNIDDKNGAVMLQNTRAKKQTYALKTIADFKGKLIEKSFSGSLLTINDIEVWTKLIGVFNVYNLLAVYGVACTLGIEKMEVLRLLSNLESIGGRFQYLVSQDNITAIIDYAHTPDALKNVLETIKDIRTGQERVITVVGCGGDRDRSKRPKMAFLASQLSDQVIFTSDNPRTEDPESIIEEMENGIEEGHLVKTLSIVNRRQAIKAAYKLAKKGDIILIAGKGHETYQEINGERYHFNDLEEVESCFNQLKKS